jgi:hypothetical protein
LIAAAGELAAGAHQGDVTIPLARGSDISRADRACLRVGGSSKLLIGGERGLGGIERVDGKRQPGAVSLIYLRPGSESWWELLPTLKTRFGLGKASFFGDWTLPVIALLLLGVWIATVRLLLGELR